jgi:hypothetical protein
MNLAVVVMGVCVTFCFAAAVALFFIDQSAAAWATLVIALLSTLSLLAMVVSTGRAETSVADINSRRRL